MNGAECLFLLLCCLALVTLLGPVAFWRESKSKTRRRGFDDANFAQCFTHLPISHSQLLTLYHYLQGFFLIKDFPLYPHDSIDDACGLDDYYNIYDLIEDLLEALKIRRSHKHIARIVDHHDPRTIQDLITAMALLITPAGETNHQLPN
jgi:hypothetical protein